jgi:peptidoglycan hydrolase-like protein with peptidoglycan-binding domain
MLAPDSTTTLAKPEADRTFAGEDEIIASVQIELYNQGYYLGPIDGIIGPDRQAAIADYEADYGPPVTAAIDEQTVESLGLV